MAEKKTLNLRVIEPTVVDGTHHPIGAILEDVELELAYILAGSGKAVVLKDEDVADAKKAAKGGK